MSVLKIQIFRSVSLSNITSQQQQDFKDTTFLWNSINQTKGILENFGSLKNIRN